METWNSRIDELARQLLGAEEQCTPIDPLDPTEPDLSEALAYAIQLAIVDRKVRLGDQVTGKKSGATNQGAMSTFGLSEPFYGHLLQSGLVGNAGTVHTARLIHPRVECEIAFRLGQDLVGPDVTEDDVIAATDALFAAFEIVDTRIRDWKLLGKYDVVADNGLTARYVLGQSQQALAGLDLMEIPVVLTKNGATVAEGFGKAVLGNPAASVAWLVNKLATQNRQLMAGEIVLAGSLTPLQPVIAGDQLEAVFEGIGGVSVQFK